MWTLACCACIRGSDSEIIDSDMLDYEILFAEIMVVGACALLDSGILDVMNSGL